VTSPVAIAALGYIADRNPLLVVTMAGQRGCRGDDVAWPPVTQHV